MAIVFDNTEVTNDLNKSSLRRVEKTEVQMQRVKEWKKCKREDR